MSSMDHHSQFPGMNVGNRQTDRFNAGEMGAFSFPPSEDSCSNHRAESSISYFLGSAPHFSELKKLSFG